MTIESRWKPEMFHNSDDFEAAVFMELEIAKQEERLRDYEQKLIFAVKQLRNLGERAEVTTRILTGQSNLIKTF